MEPYEMQPGAGGCGCGGGCSGEKKATPVHPLLGRALERFELLGQNDIGASLPSTWLESSIGRVTHGLGSAPGPGSNPCAALSAQIVVLHDRIDAMWRRMRDALGTESADRLRGTWRAARAACAAVTASDPCQALWDSWQASPLEGPGVALRNAIWHVWNQCSVNRAQFVAASGPNGFLCYLLRENARRLERDLSTRRGVTPPYNYERDIEPLERVIEQLVDSLRQCLSGGQGQTPEPYCGDVCEPGAGCATCCLFQCGWDGAAACQELRCNPLRQARH